MLDYFLSKLKLTDGVKKPTSKKADDLAPDVKTQDAFSNQLSPFMSLPKEIWWHILSFVEPIDLLRVKLTCSEFLLLAKDDTLWQAIADQLDIKFNSLYEHSNHAWYQSVNTYWQNEISYPTTIDNFAKLPPIPLPNATYFYGVEMAATHTEKALRSTLPALRPGGYPVLFLREERWDEKTDAISNPKYQAYFFNGKYKTWRLNVFLPSTIHGSSTFEQAECPLEYLSKILNGPVERKYLELEEYPTNGALLTFSDRYANKEDRIRVRLTKEPVALKKPLDEEMDPIISRVCYWRTIAHL